MKKKGFTLVELLVVIAILAILATVSIVGYTSFIQKANDSNALTETKQIHDLVYAELIDVVGKKTDTITVYAKCTNLGEAAKDAKEEVKWSTSDKVYIGSATAPATWTLNETYALTANQESGLTYEYTLVENDGLCGTTKTAKQDEAEATPETWDAVVFSYDKTTGSVKIEVQTDAHQPYATSTATGTDVFQANFIKEFGDCKELLSTGSKLAYDTAKTYLTYTTANGKGTCYWASCKQPSTTVPTSSN